MKTKSLLLITLSSSLFVFAAQAKPNGQGGEAQGERPSPQELFEQFDTDASGTLSLEEVKGPLAEHFDKIDADDNGEISKKELIAAKKKMHTRAGNGPRGQLPNLKEADTDENGAISKAEATEAGMERLLEHFDKIDANGDGEITKEEMKAMRKGRQGPPEDE
ncbi:hypothetical protein QEH59_11395 [Coraliomargarita sp. SDUM461004]|uniref:EF-hand domain-containing protein n=1 Tax=Thalassobacterium sedimentorum TaxID=3041258 RepID=A0ABU1ALF6_9BACT|nr:hypothetical protein [Coraliomargarita sp. SDUM461004]MDQ8195033.1 hypothetical protein [Coraliomargarita sp. SDUM461004]